MGPLDEHHLGYGNFPEERPVGLHYTSLSRFTIPDRRCGLTMRSRTPLPLSVCFAHVNEARIIEPFGPCVQWQCYTHTHWHARRVFGSLVGCLDSHVLPNLSAPTWEIPAVVTRGMAYRLPTSMHLGCTGEVTMEGGGEELWQSIALPITGIPSRTSAR